MCIHGWNGSSSWATVASRESCPSFGHSSERTFVFQCWYVRGTGVSVSVVLQRTANFTSQCWRCSSTAGCLTKATCLTWSGQGSTWKIPYVYRAQTSLFLLTKILQNSSRALFCEIRVLIEKYARLTFRRIEFELWSGIHHPRAIWTLLITWYTGVQYLVRCTSYKVEYSVSNHSNPLPIVTLVLPQSNNSCIHNSNLSGAILTPTIFSGSVALLCGLL